MYKKNYFLVILFLLHFTNSFAQTINADSLKLKFPVCLSCDSISNASTLEPVFRKLENIQKGKDSSLVIVHIGDSHIQADFFSGAIRLNLQTIFGNKGEGLLFPYTRCKGYGPRSLNAKFTGNWTCNNVMINSKKEALGISGFSITTNDTNSSMNFKYNPSYDKYSTLKSYNQIQIWHGNNNFQLEFGPYFDTTATDSIVRIKTLNENQNWSRTIISNPNNESHFVLNFRKTNSAQTEFILHGLLFENTNEVGVQYHHCGVVGSTFTHLINNAPLLVSQLKTLKTDLVIFSFGSNESYDSYFDSTRYFTKVAEFVENLKKEIPTLQILFTTVPDTRSNNRYPKFTQPINRNIKTIAVKTNSAVWDLNTIMGGDNSIRFWYQTKLSNTDKLHFSKQGYTLQGDLFSLAFLEAYNKTSSKSILLDSLRLKINNAIPEINTELKNKISNSGNQTLPQKNTTIHIIRSGETLYSIAKKYHVTITDICNWNQINRKSILKVGKKLIIKRL